MKYTERVATDDDFDFLYELKKAAEFDVVSRVFGWDEKVQCQIHEEEWSKARPTILEVSGNRVGSYLFELKGDSYNFGRFFLLPEYQGQGIGSSVINDCMSRAKPKAIELCYLVGNKVHRLYERHGFIETGKDEHFVYMRYHC